MTDAVEVVEYTDPWCSWAWGTEPKLRRLQWRYGDRFVWRRVMGDLVARRPAGQPEPDPARLATYWKGAYEHTGQTWPVRLQWAPAASEVAGRSVKAAERQGAEVGGRLLRAIRESCFIHGTPADNEERVVEVARAIDGLDADKLADDLGGSEVAAAFLADRDETRDPNEYVRTLQETHIGKGNVKEDGDRWRYVFPTLLFRGPGGEHTVPGWQPWEAYVAAMEAAVPGSTTAPRPDPTPAEVLDRWDLVTERELTFLCGEVAEPPADAVPVDWGAGTAWTH